MGIDYEFLEGLCTRVLNQQESIRWCAIANRTGVILSQKKRQGLALLLSDEENEQYAATAIARQKTRSMFEPRIGKLTYASGRYEKLIRITVPVDENYFMLLSLDVNAVNFDSLVIEHILPLVLEERPRFIIMNDSI